MFDLVARPDPGYIYALRPDGRGELLAELPPVYPNGIVAEPDGSVVWVESLHRAPCAAAPTGRSRTCRAAGGPHPRRAEGRGERRPLDHDHHLGRPRHGGAGRRSTRSLFDAGCIPLNCVFDGTLLYITDQGEFDTTAAAKDTGRLVRVDTGVEGMPLMRGTIPALAD